MEQSEVFKKMVEIVTPFVKNKEALAAVSMKTSILNDLKVNSARLVDIVLKIEQVFGIEVSDDDVDKVSTIGEAVNFILSKSK